MKSNKYKHIKTLDNMNRQEKVRYYKELIS